VPALAVNNLIASINTLADAGARNFLVVNSPDLGSTPAFRGTGNQTLMTLLSSEFNTALENQLNTLATAKPQLDIEQFQLDDALNSLIAERRAPNTNPQTNTKGDQNDQTYDRRRRAGAVHRLCRRADRADGNGRGLSSV
jgi:phospholipase/lecithinase/hemolysin